MKNLYLLLSLLVVSLTASAQFDRQNISLLDQFDDPAVTAEPQLGIRYQSCWGWSFPANGMEFGIVGTTAGTYVLHVSSSGILTVADYIPGRSTDRIWHEFKTYDYYLYIIADGGNNTLQIADMSYLPDSVHLVHNSDSIFDSGHTLYIDGDKMYVASVTLANGNYSSMNVYSLANPEAPALLRRLDQDYPAIGQVHDMFVVNDTVYASCGYDGLYIFRFDEISGQFIQLGSLTTYPQSGYNHSTFLSEDHTMLYMCDEVPTGLAIKVVDVTDIQNPTTVHTFRSNVGATPHNPYVKGNQLYIAYYQDGMYMYDLTDPSLPVQSGYFDTHYQNPPGTYPNPKYSGCWAVYTDLPSGIILASDMQNGLFTLDVSMITGVQEQSGPAAAAVVYPNPARDQLQVRCGKNFSGLSEVSIADLSGKIVLNKKLNTHNGKLMFDVSSLSDGFYLLSLKNDQENIQQKIQLLR